MALTAVTAERHDLAAALLDKLVGLLGARGSRDAIGTRLARKR